MFNLLLVVSPDTEEHGLFSTMLSREAGFGPVCVAPDAAQARKMLTEASFDAVGAVPGTDTELAITALLDELDSPIPLFPLRADSAPEIIRDLKHLLNRLHVDYLDQPLPQKEMVRVVLSELVHNLLTGSLKDPGVLPRWFQMLRAQNLLDVPCRVWELSIPQGDGYLSGRWHYGTQRLENALCRSFFANNDQDALYQLAFVDSSAARLIAIPQVPAPNLQRTERMIHLSIEQIKDYLDLDIIISDAETVPSLIDAGLPQTA